MEAVKDKRSELTLTPELERVFRDMASRYIWWKDTDSALKYPQQIAAQVMNLGEWDDVQIFADAVGDDYLRFVLKNAEAGQFSERSWTYWHYRLHLAKIGTVPPLPERIVA